MKKGGKYLGEGSYGCSLDPAPVCSETPEFITKDSKLRKNATVGKVFMDDEDSIDEWQIAKKLAVVDPRQKYFLYPVSKCTTSLESVRTAETNGVCTRLERRYANAPPKNTKLHMLRSINGGIPLDSYVKNKKVSPQEFLASFSLVFQGMQKLHRAGLIHHDLKFDNILIDPKTKECRIIDFGMIINKDDALSFENKFIGSKYWLHPPEYRIFSTMTKRKWAPLDDIEIRREIATQIGMYKITFDKNDPSPISSAMFNDFMFSYCEYEQALLEYVQKLSKQKTMGAMLGYIQKYPQKIDVYSAGISLVYLSLHLDYTKSSQMQLQKFFNLLKHMIHPDPRKRYTMARCLKEAKEIIG